MDFIRYYAETAISVIEHPRNQPGWACLINKTADNILFEQYLLSACINYHHNKIDSPFHKIDIRYLFTDPDQAFFLMRPMSWDTPILLPARSEMHRYPRVLKDEFSGSIPNATSESSKGQAYDTSIRILPLDGDFKSRS